MWSRCERWATYFVFGVGYRRTDHVYYFNSSGYWSRSSPLLVSRAPSVHLPLTHTPKLCPYLQSSEAQPSSHTSIRVTPGLASARLGYCRVIPATGLNWSEVVHEVGIFVNVGRFFFFLSKNTLCLTYSLKSLIYDSHFSLYNSCWEILRFSGWNLYPIIYWHLLDMWSQCMCMSLRWMQKGSDAVWLTETSESGEFWEKILVRALFEWPSKQNTIHSNLQKNRAFSSVDRLHRPTEKCFVKMVQIPCFVHLT